MTVDVNGRLVISDLDMAKISLNRGYLLRPNMQ
jgi:hypothetical protein